MFEKPKRVNIGVNCSSIKVFEVITGVVRMPDRG